LADKIFVGGGEMKFENSIDGHVECVITVDKYLTSGMRYWIKDISLEDETVRHTCETATSLN
jgi:hypothetical protein